MKFKIRNETPKEDETLCFDLIVDQQGDLSLICWPEKEPTAKEALFFISHRTGKLVRHSLSPRIRALLTTNSSRKIATIEET